MRAQGRIARPHGYGARRFHAEAGLLGRLYVLDLCSGLALALPQGLRCDLSALLLDDQFNR